MTQQQWLDAVTDLDPDILERYFTVKPTLTKKRQTANRRWATWGAVAACFLAISTMFLVRSSGDTSAAVVDNSLGWALICVLLMSLLSLNLVLIKRELSFKQSTILYAVSFVAINLFLVLCSHYAFFPRRILIYSNVGMLLLLGFFTLFTRKTKIRWKKIVLLLLAFIISITMTACYAAGAFDKYNPDTWFETTSTGGISDRKAEKVTVGMTLEEVVDILGKPQRDTGSGTVIMEWDMRSGKILVVCFNSDPNDHYDPNTQQTGEWISYHIEIRDKTE